MIPADKISERIKAMTASIAKWRDGKASLAAIDAISKRLPKILYFANYDRMNGDVSLKQLQRNISKGNVDPGDNVFRSFLKFAGTSVEDIASLDRYEKMKARVEAASLTISKRIFRFWSQNRHLKVQYSLEAGRPGDPAPFDSGSVMRTRILNELHGMTVPSMILVLYDRSTINRSALAGLETLHGHELKPFLEFVDQPGGGFIGHSSVHKAKGLDALGVILVGLRPFEQLATPYDRFTYFMGASRARQLLACVHVSGLRGTNASNAASFRS